MITMKKEQIGIGVILFAILLQLCSNGIEWLTLGLGIVGLIITVKFSLKSE
jgi:hypothetical protein